MVSKQIHTTIAPEKYEKAMLKNVKWSEAMELGIDILAGKEESILEHKIEIDKHNRMIKYHEGKIVEIEERKKNTKTTIELILSKKTELDNAVSILNKKPHLLDVWRKRWNKITAMGLTSQQYLALIEAHKQNKINEVVLEWKK